ncbi:hypothetical protein F0562_030425 [Nyssa sinensis]|uniref:DUF4220 domain-containing protein n=1 Tax=Nyssa sinensis TaxID=561372 RepID=A0A5J5AYB8_9ASTE|nr:hypothetical protein F0562_030425 [Nyssa sinensis]
MDPIPAVVRLWDVWDVRMLIIFSLILQTILFIFGNRRKYNTSIWLQTIVWFAYLVADWVATVALSKLSDALVDSKNNALGLIWAPLLLLHLGGPDTITAYSMEDNQLWLRHFFGLVVQFMVAIYVILLSWRNFEFSFLAFPLFVAGIIKYGERTWVLRSACGEQAQQVPFGSKEDEQHQNIPTEQKDEHPQPRDSPTEKEDTSTEQEDEQPRPSNSPTKKEDNSIEQEDAQHQNISTEQKDKHPQPRDSPTEKEDTSTEQEDEQPWPSNSPTKKEDNSIEQEDAQPQHVLQINDIQKEVEHIPIPSYPDAEVLVLAHQLLDLHKPHIANYVISEEYGDKKNLLLQDHMEQDSLKYLNAIEVEMGLMYDLLYTKASITYTKAGFILRSISFICTVSVVVGFFLMAFLGKKWHEHYSIVDIAITGALLVGAFILEMYAIIVILSSDWTMLWLIKHRKYQLAAQTLFRKFPWLFSMNRQRRWSNSMGQFNLLSFCFKDKPMKFSRILKLFGIGEKLDKYMHNNCLDTTPGYLKEHIFKFIVSEDSDVVEAAYSYEIDESIILMHIVTHAWYHDRHQDSHMTAELEKKKEISKLLSDYMMYLLVMHPFMLPGVLVDVLFRHATTTLKKKFQGKRRSVEEGCWEELSGGQEDSGETSTLIASVKQKMEEILKEEITEQNKRWQVLSSFWTLAVCTAAKQCQQNYHARQLVRGGELLSLVWFILAQCTKYSESGMLSAASFRMALTL